jgi:hypothetical protein
VSVLGPLASATTDGAIRAAGRGDALVAAAVDQRGDEMVEHDSVRDTAAVTDPRLIRGELGAVIGTDQRGELDPQRLGEGCWKQRRGLSR